MTHPATEARVPSRDVVHGDALAWLEANPRTPGASLVASIPDVSEVGVSLDAWRVLFRRAARLAMDATPDEGICFFFQTDIKPEGRWVSKVAMIFAAAEEAAIPLLWHKIVCRREPGLVSRGRPGYSHFLAFSRGVRDDPMRATPDVLPDLGVMPWSHSMGTRAAELAMTTMKTFSPATSRVVVPFCGIGTALAIANLHGYDALGIERNRKRAEAARTLRLDDLAGSEDAD